MADSPSFPLSLDCAFDRILADAAKLGGNVDQSRLIDRSIALGSTLLNSANRASRMLASLQNSQSWPLPPDLTVKVFSMIDTQSLCYAAITCTMFRKCAMDPMCYSDIDLRTVGPNVNNAVVSTMIQRAGNAIQSLKLGFVPGKTAPASSCQSLVDSIRKGKSISNVSFYDKTARKSRASILTRTCLSPLSTGNGATGVLLRRLYLYNIELMDNTSLRGALSACPGLLDLEIVGLRVELKHVIESVSKNCHLIDRLSFDSFKTGRDDSLKSSACIDFVNNCRSLTSLTLRGFKLHDVKARLLVKGFRELKYVDFSNSYSITGQFLRSLGNDSGGNSLEFLLLRDCMHLREVEVSRFLTSVQEGDFQSIRHIDISNKEGLASEGDWYKRCYPSNLPLKKVMEERPGIVLVADFPSGYRFVDMEQGVDSEMETNNHLSDTSTSWSDSSLSSYSSDQGSGNDGASQDSGMMFYDESSDELDF